MPLAADLTPLEAQRMADDEQEPASTAPTASTSAPADTSPLAEPPTLTQAPAVTTTMSAQPPSAMSPSTGADTAPASTTTAPAMPMPEEDSLQAKLEDDAAGGFEAGPRVERQLAATQGQGAPLPEALRAKMETGIGAGFGAVRVHTGGDSVQLNRSLQAQAFTNGSDIYMGAGKYNPSSADGQRLLAHELTHVVQQGAAEPAVQRRLAVSPAGDAAEQEADQLASEVLRQPSAEEEEKPA
jgi:hypothetical protein